MRPCQYLEWRSNMLCSKVNKGDNNGSISLSHKWINTMVPFNKGRGKTKQRGREGGKGRQGGKEEGKKHKIFYGPLEWGEGSYARLNPDGSCDTCTNFTHWNSSLTGSCNSSSSPLWQNQELVCQDTSGMLEVLLQKKNVAAYLAFFCPSHHRACPFPAKFSLVTRKKRHTSMQHPMVSNRAHFRATREISPCVSLPSYATVCSVASPSFRHCPLGRGCFQKFNTMHNDMVRMNMPLNK